MHGKTLQRSFCILKMTDSFLFCRAGGKIAEFNSTLIINVTADYHNAVFRCLAGNVNGLNFTDVRFRIVAVNSGGNGMSSFL